MTREKNCVMLPRDLPRHCLYCHEPIRGRSDKRYCSDHCRSAAYQQNHLENTTLFRQTHQLLLHNRNILLALYRQKSRRYHRHDLERCGLHIQYCTCVEKMQNGLCRYWNYDFAIEEAGDDYFHLRYRAIPLPNADPVTYRLSPQIARGG